MGERIVDSLQKIGNRGFLILDFGSSHCRLRNADCGMKKQQRGRSRNSEASFSNGAGEEARRGKDREHILLKYRMSNKEFRMMKSMGGRWDQAKGHEGNTFLFSFSLVLRLWLKIFSPC